MPRVISALMRDPFSQEALFGLVVSDDDFAVSFPSSIADADPEPLVNDYTMRFKECSADALERFNAARYNTIYLADGYSDEPDGDFEKIKASMSQKVSEEA